MAGDALDALALRTLAPFDALRARLLRRFGPALGPLLARPARRHAILGSAGVCVAFVLSSTVLVWLLALGPLLLGIPHLVADLRYLVLQPGLARRSTVRMLVFAPLALVSFFPLVPLTGLLTVGAALFARGLPGRRLVVMLVGAALFELGLAAGQRGAVLFAHLHHVIALGTWWWMRRDRGLPEALVLALAAGGALTVWSGLLDDRLPALILLSADVLSPELLVTTLSPDPNAHTSLRWVWLFAFGQSVHYLVWLRLIPDDRRGRAAPRPFTASYHALRAELGSFGLLVSVALVLALLAWTAHGLCDARDAYLRLALFHGPLEVALLALAFAEGRRP